MAKYTKCSECGTYKPPWFQLCYPCHMRKMENTGFIPSLFLFIWLPCIPTLLILAFGKAFADIGMSNFLLGLLWIALTIILAAYKYQELENMINQFKKGNWF
ncbi:hypothetical protein HQ529_06860 [Candidatus Woesearchaeota archaeon]|nr:hypothetical protein [Candidatus Woesearchaeota archaeon]